MQQMIQFHHVSKSYMPGTYVVHDVNLAVAEHEMLVLLGESGCGKTTMLKMINRLIEPTSGKILVDGEDVSAMEPVALRRRIGYVFQGIGLFPHLSVGENVGIVLKLLQWEPAAIAARVDHLLHLVGLEPAQYKSRKPEELSGGQQQRVGVARALAAEPKIMLMDEPFGALDPIRRNSLQAEFQQLRTSLGLTVVMVTHDMTEALLMADRIAVMQEGRVVALGTPHELMTTTIHPYAAALLSTPKQQADKLEALSEQHRDLRTR
jgi:osmoprotectant transport system ATP-binding protein